MAFCPDGDRVLTGGAGKPRLWEFPPPLEGSVDQIVLWVQVITGMELDESGAVRVLDLKEWHRRKRQLEQLGGPPMP